MGGAIVVLADVVSEIASFWYLNIPPCSPQSGESKGCCILILFACVVNALAHSFVNLYN